MPVYQGIHPEVVKNIVGLDLTNQMDGGAIIRLHFPQSSIITYSRNKIMAEALKDDADWLLMWDSDIQIEGEDFFKKMKDIAFKHDAPVVGLPCRLRTDNVTYNFAHLKEGKYVNAKEMPQEAKEVDVCGTGCVLINLHWMRKNWMKGPWFTIIDTMNGDVPGFWPEDFNFTQEITKLGGKIMVAPINTTHHASYGYKTL